MQIDNQHSTNFKAKFFDSPSLREVAKYAVEKGKFGKLHNAAKNISKDCMTTRLFVTAGLNESGQAFVTFSKYVPKDTVVVARKAEDYKFIKDRTYVSEEKINPLKFAMKKIIKMGNSAPSNGIFRDVVYKNS